MESDFGLLRFDLEADCVEKTSWNQCYNFASLYMG